MARGRDGDRRQTLSRRVVRLVLIALVLSPVLLTAIVDAGSAKPKPPSGGLPWTRGAEGLRADPSAVARESLGRSRPDHRGGGAVSSDGPRRHARAFAGGGRQGDRLRVAPRVSRPARDSVRRAPRDADRLTADRLWDGGLPWLLPGRHPDDRELDVLRRGRARSGAAPSPTPSGRSSGRTRPEYGSGRSRRTPTPRGCPTTTGSTWSPCRTRREAVDREPDRCRPATFRYLRGDPRSPSGTPGCTWRQS